MPNATLTSGAPSADLATTPGALYAFGLTGDFGGGAVTMFASLPATPTVFFAVDGGDFRQPVFRQFRAPGSFLKVELTSPDARGVSSVNAEITEAS